MVTFLQDLAAFKYLKNKFCLGAAWKQCKLSLVQPLLLLFIKCITRGIISSFWKKVFCYPKQGTKNDVINYRSVSVLGSITKLLDKNIINRFTYLFIANVIEQQHSFVSGRPTLINLFLYNAFLSNVLNSKYRVDSIYLDYSMFILGLNCLKSHASDRILVIRINGQRS